MPTFFYAILQRCNLSFYVMIEILYKHYLISRQVTTDSRNCPPNSIYFALKGERFNGNNFALDAISKGCAIAVVDDVSLKGKKGCFWVPDTLQALQQLAAYHRRCSEVKVIAITGSNGKTTTKELLAQVLSKKFNIWFTQGNLNNHIGVPLTILSMPKGTELLVVEMGANHGGEIAELCFISDPDLGLVTNVGKAHIEGFGSIEGVKKAKGELYDYLKQKGGTIFISWDNKHLKDMLGDSYNNVFKYGSSMSNHVIGEDISVDPYLKFKWRKNIKESYFIVDTHLTGIYNLENALAAISVGVFFKVADFDINNAICCYYPANHRSQIVETDNNRVILDAYNANPASMSVALDNFIALKGDKRVLIIGGMKELGNESKQEHLLLLNRIDSIESDLVFLIGEEFKDLAPDNSGYLWFDSVQSLIPYLNTHPLDGCFILVKGSRSNMLEKVMTAL